MNTRYEPPSVNPDLTLFKLNLAPERHTRRSHMHLKSIDPSEAFTVLRKHKLKGMSHRSGSTITLNMLDINNLCVYTPFNGTVDAYLMKARHANISSHFLREVDIRIALLIMSHKQMIPSSTKEILKKKTIFFDGTFFTKDTEEFIVGLSLSKVGQPFLELKPTTSVFTSEDAVLVYKE